MEVQNILPFFDVAAVHCTLLCTHPHNPSLSIFFSVKKHMAFTWQECSLQM